MSAAHFDGKTACYLSKLESDKLLEVIRQQSFAIAGDAAAWRRQTFANARDMLIDWEIYGSNIR